MQGRGQGKELMARRTLEPEEFNSTIKIAKTANTVNIKHGLVALLKFAFHFIGRLDGTCKLQNNKILPSTRHPDTIITGQLEPYRA
jgi:hypothetical protein